MYFFPEVVYYGTLFYCCFIIPNDPESFNDLYGPFGGQIFLYYNGCKKKAGANGNRFLFLIHAFHNVPASSFCTYHTGTSLNMKLHM